MTFTSRALPRHKRGQGLIITGATEIFGAHTVLSGWTQDGTLCFLGFTDDLDMIAKYYPKADIHQGTAPADWQSCQSLYVEGTPFQIRVWQALQDIKPGVTTTYGELAQHLGKPKGARAIGGAVGANPISDRVPCHRVLHSGNAQVGYAWGADVKKDLLAQEAKSH